MSLATALLTPILGDASPWTPRRLFQLGEAGGVYDPSDLTAEKVAWRRNLLTWSEDFTNAAWTRLGSTVSANATVAPDGTTTADKLVEDTSTGVHLLLPSSFPAIAIGVTYTASVYAKAAERTRIQLRDNGTSSAGATFDLSSGVVANQEIGLLSAGIENVGSGWYRCRITYVAGAASANIQVRLVSSGTTTSYTGDGTSGAFPWGIQLEVGSTATAYQRITDFTSDFLAAFPTHGLYQDAAGTTPVTALGQPVGLVIDSKTGGLANLGAEQLSNNEFTSNVTGWSAAGSATLTWDSSGAALVDITGAGGGIQDTQTLALTVGRTYRVVTSVRAGTFASQLALQANNVTIATITPTAAYQTVTAYFTAPSADPPISILRNLAATGTIFVDFISVREVPGVHAIQPTNSSRPLLDGRVNLLERTEEFDNAVWTANAIGLTVSANNAVGPDGATTADRIVETATTGLHVTQQQVAITAGATYRIAVFAKAAERTVVQIATQLATWGTNFYANFDLANGTAHNQAAASATIQSFGNGWYLCAITATSAGTGTPNISFGPVLSTSSGVFPSYAGNASNGLLLVGADLRLAADAAYPYQRVAAATDYADVGVPRSFLFDGFDDSFYTASNMDLSGTDKVTVLAGVRKLSDAARGAIAETGASYAIAGGFGVLASETSGTNYQFGLGGSTGNIDYVPTGFAAPITNVLSALYDLAGTTKATELIPRINGVVSQTGGGGTVAGAGNFTSGILNIGRRNNASLPFSGKAYQLIVRGALTDDATLAQAQRYVGAKTGLYL